MVITPQIHHDHDVLEEIRHVERTLEGIKIISTGFDGQVCVKISADTMDRLKERIWRLRQVNFVSCCLTKGDTFEK